MSIAIVKKSEPKLPFQPDDWQQWCVVIDDGKEFIGWFDSQAQAATVADKLNSIYAKVES